MLTDADTVIGDTVAIRRVDVVPISIPLRKPVKMARSIVAAAETLIVRVESADGTVGWGEAAAAANMTGETLASMTFAARKFLAPIVTGSDARDYAATVASFDTVLYGNNAAKSAVETALLDVLSRSRGTSLSRFIGGPVRDRIAPMWLLANASADLDVAEARRKIDEGFRFFKLKVGAKSLEDDIACTLAVRAAIGTDIPLCADANTGLGDNASAYLDAVASASLLYLEQPMAAHDLYGMARVAASSEIPIAADEGIHGLTDIRVHAHAKAAAGVSLKAIKLGGLNACVQAARFCRATGMAVNIATKIAESSIGSAATLHLACAVPSVEWGVSMTHFYLADDLVSEPPVVEEGMVRLPTGSGLGISVDEAKLERYRVPLRDLIV
jgi:muconate cycloisomerase